MKTSKSLFFETPKEKSKVFEEPELVMIYDHNIVQTWNNTQPLYFYPFSWLDYLKFKGLREIQIIDCDETSTKKALEELKEGKVHFEGIDIKGIDYALAHNHKVSVLCNLEDIKLSHILTLSNVDFLKVRINEERDLNKLRNVARTGMLSCVKAYAREGHDFVSLARKVSDVGFDVLHIAKRLEDNVNPDMTYEEKASIIQASQLDLPNLKIKIPSSLDKAYAERFVMGKKFNNSQDCSFSEYRKVLYHGKDFPCYTRKILSSPAEKGLVSRVKKACDDCACIYENDMLSKINEKRREFKRHKFALRYIQHGK
ncbi:MAG: hypothetical protein KKE23_01745 [Nanoarchaeota archaeon]|nr:hypothetical protein [Nanoarchaeota archaeon]